MAMDIATLGIEVKSSSVVTASNALSTMQQKAVAAEKSTANLTKSTSQLQSGMLAAAKAAGALLAGFSLYTYAKDAVLAAARYETLGVVLTTAGKNANYASFEMAAFEKQLQKNGIAMQESRETLVSLATANIDLSKASQLARTAQDVAVVGGINSSEAFARMTHGIKSAQVEILRTIGINVSFEESYKKLAAEIGTTASALTAQQKTQARVNAVLEEGAKYMGIYEASMETAGKQLSSLPRYFQNISVLVGELGLETFSSGIQAVTKEAKAAEAALQEMKKSGELAEMGKTIGSVFSTIAGQIDTAVVAFAAWIAVQKAVQIANALTAKSTVLLGGHVMATTKSVGLLSAAFTYLRASSAGLIAALGGPWVVGLAAAAGAMYALYDSMKNGREEIAAQTDAYDKLLQKINGVADATERQTEAMRLVEVYGSLEKLRSLGDEYDALYEKQLKAQTVWVQGMGNQGGDTQMVASLNAMQEETLKTISAIENLRERSTATQDAIAKLELMRNGSNTAHIDALQMQLRNLFVTYEKIVREEQKLGNLAGAKEGARAAADEAKELLEQWTKFDAIVKEHTASKVVAGDIASAAEYAYEFLENTKYGAGEQSRLKEESIQVALNTLQAARAAEILAWQVASAVGPAADLGERLARIASLEGLISDVQKGIASGPKTTSGGGGGSNQRASAQKQLAEINIEIDKMLGIDTSQLELDKKLKEIAETAKTAGVNAAEFQRRYTEAFNAQKARELDKELKNIEVTLLSLEGRNKEAGILSLSLELEEMEKKLISLGASTEVVATTLQRMKSASENSLKVDDLEAAASFMSELASLSGNYGMAVEYNNQLLQARADIYRQTLPEALHAYVDQWQALQQLQNATDPFSGMQRGMLKWAADAGNMAQQMETLVTSTFDSMADSLATFVTTGKLDFSSLAASISADLAKIAIQVMMSNALSSLFGGVFGGSSSGISGGIASGASSILGAIMHSGGIVGKSGTPSRMVDPLAFVGAPKFHNGGMVGGERAIIAKDGEGVFTPGQMAALAPVGSTASSIVINQAITINTEGQTNTDGSFTSEQYQMIQKQMKQMVETTVVGVITRQQRAGGQLSAR